MCSSDLCIIDYSQVPQPMMQALNDGLEVQIGWLEQLLERTRSFRARLLKSCSSLIYKKKTPADSGRGTSVHRLV